MYILVSQSRTTLVINKLFLHNSYNMITPYSFQVGRYYYQIYQPATILAHLFRIIQLHVHAALRFRVFLLILFSKCQRKFSLPYCSRNRARGPRVLTEDKDFFIWPMFKLSVASSAYLLMPSTKSFSLVCPF